MRDTNGAGKAEDPGEREMGTQLKRAKRVFPVPGGSSSLEQVKTDPN